MGKDNVSTSNTETFEERIKKLVQPASRVKKKKKKAVRTITRANTNAVNRSIAPKLQQNAMEREASKKKHIMMTKFGFSS